VMSCTKCGCEIPSNSKFCLECGTSVVAERPAAAADFGAIIFGSFSLLSLIVFLAQGLVPIYFVEAAAWALVAWLWRKRKPTSQLNTTIMLFLAVAVAASEGYLLGARSAARGRYSTQLDASVPPGFVVDSVSPTTDIRRETVTKATPERSMPPRNENPKAATPRTRQEFSPPPTCSTPLLPDENRTPTALGSAELALVHMSLASTNADSLLLDVEDGSSYCVTSIAVESGWAKTDKALNQTLLFSPAISPGEKQNQHVSNEIYLNGGGSERVTGLVKHWSITEVRGFPVSSNKSQ